MTKVRVLFDAVGIPGDGPTYAHKGDVIELSGAELERLLELGAVEKASDTPTDPAVAKRVGDMSVPELKARAQTLGVTPTGGSKATRDDLIRAVTEHDPHAGSPPTAEAVPAPSSDENPDPTVDLDDLRTPALDPIGDGKTDQSEIDRPDGESAKAVGGEGKAGK
jgi:hypothetical protein